MKNDTIENDLNKYTGEVNISQLNGSNNKHILFGKEDAKNPYSRIFITYPLEIKSDKPERQLIFYYYNFENAKYEFDPSSCDKNYSGVSLIDAIMQSSGVPLDYAKNMEEYLINCALKS